MLGGESLVWCLQIPKVETCRKETIKIRVEEVMTRHVEVIGTNAPLIEAAAKMKSLEVGLIPICEG